MNILVVNWQDRENPHAGGAEIHLFEIFRRLAAGGHRVRLVCSGWPGAPPRTTLDGIEVERTGGRSSFALLGRGAVRRALAAERPDVVVEDINKLPLFLAGMTDRPFCAIVPHLFGATAFEEAPWPLGRDRVGVGASAGARVPSRVVPCDQREHPGRSRGARRRRVAGSGHPSRGGPDALRAGEGWTTRTESRLLVRWTAEAL